MDPIYREIPRFDENAIIRLFRLQPNTQTCALSFLVGWRGNKRRRQPSFSGTIKSSFEKNEDRCSYALEGLSRGRINRRVIGAHTVDRGGGKGLSAAPRARNVHERGGRAITMQQIPIDDGRST